MTKVKICGLSTPEAVATAVEAGADYIGFVFAKSKRQVSLEQAHELAKGVTGQTKIVGVFVSPSLEELEEAIGKVPLDIVQIHGTFDEDLIPKISVPVIRAIQISDSESQVKSQADYLLFDAPIAGSGQTFDWQLLADKQIEQDYFIAGGLIFLYRKELAEFTSKHKVIAGAILLIAAVAYFALGGNTLTMLFFCVAALVYALGCTTGGGTGQSSCQVPRWYQLRDLPVPHGNLSCA